MKGERSMTNPLHQARKRGDRNSLEHHEGIQAVPWTLEDYEKLRRGVIELVRSRITVGNGNVMVESTAWWRVLGLLDRSES